jgi:hypothetical protein
VAADDGYGVRSSAGDSITFLISRLERIRNSPECWLAAAATVRWDCLGFRADLVAGLIGTVDPCNDRDGIVLVDPRRNDGASVDVF